MPSLPTDASAGDPPAIRAGSHSYFADWCGHAQKSGREWFVLSTHYGLVRPDELIEDYDVPVGEAHRNNEYLARVRGQLDELEAAPEDVVVLDWEAFQALVATALGVPPDRVGLRKLRF